MNVLSLFDGMSCGQIALERVGIKVDDNYTSLGYDLNKDKIVPISNTQRYKMLGNGWTIDVISHIFKNLKQTK